MARKKKVEEELNNEELYKEIASLCRRGFYGFGDGMKEKVNSLGYGDIFDFVVKYVNI